ncbi:MAG: SGNH/GDSL hydrolase family protein [Candidatus Aminicenantales bacterium]
MIRLSGILALFFLLQPLWAGGGDTLYSRPAIQADGTAGAVVRSADGIWGILSSGPVLTGLEFAPLLLDGDFEELGLFCDNRDRLWLAGTELEGETEMIRLGRLENGAFAESRAIGINDGWNGQADLYFPETGGPWIAWHHQTTAIDEILVQDSVSGLRWRITAAGTFALSPPRIRPDGRGGLWVLWTGRSGKNYIVAGRRFDGRVWSEEVRLADNGERPSLQLDAALGKDGILYAAWSAYDGRYYRIRTAECRDDGWSEPRSLTEYAVMEQYPRLVRFGNGTAVVWASTDRAGTRLLAMIRDPARTAGPYVLSERAESPLFEAAATDQGLYLLRDDREKPRLDFLKRDDFRENRPIGELKKHTPAAARTRPAGLNPNIDRNEAAYIGFGDSITYGTIDGKDAPDKGYIPRLDAKLDGVFGPTDVFNEGVPGQMTTGGLLHIDTILAAREARYILVMEGTNDVKISNDPIDVAIYNLGEICKHCLSAGVLPILSTVIPRRDGIWDIPKYKKRHIDLNAGIRAKAPELVIPFADMENAFNSYTGGPRDLLSADGKHPNEAGYIVMTDTWYASIRALPFPPLDLELRTKGKESDSFDFLRPTRLTNKNGYGRVAPVYTAGILLSWEANPKTADISSIRGYRVYRKKQSEGADRFALIGSVPAFFAFLDLRVKTTDHFDYVVTAVGTDKVEGSRSDIVSNY